MKEIDWVQLTKWEDHTNSISLGTMRNIVARRKENGADVFFVTGERAILCESQEI